jgi:hypothetical protein
MTPHRFSSRHQYRNSWIIEMHFTRPTPDSDNSGLCRSCPNDRDVAQCRLARLIASERAPTRMRLTAQVASRLNQLRDTNLRPR